MSFWWSSCAGPDIILNLFSFTLSSSPREALIRGVFYFYFTPSWPVATAGAASARAPRPGRTGVDRCGIAIIDSDHIGRRRRASLPGPTGTTRQQLFSFCPRARVSGASSHKEIRIQRSPGDRAAPKDPATESREPGPPDLEIVRTRTEPKKSTTVIFRIRINFLRFISSSLLRLDLVPGNSELGCAY